MGVDIATKGTIEAEVSFRVGELGRPLGTEEFLESSLFLKAKWVHVWIL